VREHGEVVETREVADPLAEVERLRAAYCVPRCRSCRPSPAAWSATSVSSASATSSRAWPPMPDKPDQLGTPDILLMLSEEVAVFDNLKGRLYLIVHADPSEPQAYARAQRRLDALTHRLRHAGASYPDVLDPSLLKEEDFVSGFTREGFIAAVEKSKDYIRAGDIFQVVLSQRLRCRSVPGRWMCTARCAR
jgi:anthranilate synthase component 1